MPAGSAVLLVCTVLVAKLPPHRCQLLFAKVGQPVPVAAVAVFECPRFALAGRAALSAEWRAVRGLSRDSWGVGMGRCKH